MLDLADFLLAAERVLEIDAQRLQRVVKTAAAESALAAPHASFGGQDFYTDPVERAAILASRIMRNHPLPDGNKRVALILAELELAEHGLELIADPEEIDRIFRQAAGRTIEEDYFIVWIQSRVRPIT